MTEFNELAARLAKALDRIAENVNRANSGSEDGAEIENLREALEAERTANAQLEERVAAIREKQEKIVARLEDEVARLSDEADAMARQLGTMRDVNATLRENNAALREANAAGLGDADLINAALAGEVDALRALQAADRAEMDELIAELKPVAEGAAHA